MGNVYISIIIPVYNVENYLEQCVKSILAQASANDEILLVEDCSTDRSGEICDALAGRDPRIRVIRHAENKGISAARNSGLTECKGEWVLFIDSDDWIEPIALKKCIESLDEDLDILVCGFCRQIEDKKRIVYKKEIIIPGRADAGSAGEIGNLAIKLDTERCFSYVWNKIYSASFIEKNQLRFENMKINEDFVFNIDAFTLARRIRVIDKFFYNYRKPMKTTLSSAYVEDFFEICKRRYNIEIELLKAKNTLSDINFQKANFIHLKHIFYVINMHLASGLSRKDKKLKIKQVLGSPHTLEVLHSYKPENFKKKILKKIMLQKSVFPVIWTAGLLKTARKILPNFAA